MVVVLPIHPRTRKVIEQLGLGAELGNVTLVEPPPYLDMVALAQAAQKATLKSLEYLPMIFKDVKDAKELAKGTADYKRLVGLSYVALCELELAFIAEDEAKADEILGKLKDLKTEGHNAYTED